MRKHGFLKIFPLPFPRSKFVRWGRRPLARFFLGRLSGVHGRWILDPASVTRIAQVNHQPAIHLIQRLARDTSAIMANIPQSAPQRPPADPRTPAARKRIGNGFDGHLEEIAGARLQLAGTRAQRAERTRRQIGVLGS